MLRRTAALAITAAILSGCQVDAGPDLQAELSAQQEESDALQQRIIALAHDQTETQNELSAQRNITDQLTADRDTLGNELERRSDSLEQAVRAVDELVSCLEAQQNWSELLARRLEGGAIARDTADRALQTMGERCTAAQDATRRLDENLRTP